MASKSSFKLGPLCCPLGVFTCTIVSTAFSMSIIGPIAWEHRATLLSDIFARNILMSSLNTQFKCCANPVEHFSLRLLLGYMYDSIPICEPFVVWGSHSLGREDWRPQLHIWFVHLLWNAAWKTSNSTFMGGITKISYPCHWTRHFYTGILGITKNLFSFWFGKAHAKKPYSIRKKVMYMACTCIPILETRYCKRRLCLCECSRGASSTALHQYTML